MVHIEIIGYTRGQNLRASKARRRCENRLTLAGEPESFSNPDRVTGNTLFL